MTPDELWLPDGDILTRIEIERDLAVPAHQYAVVEQALRHAEGCDDAGPAARLGALWAGFAAVAATRPDAWDRSAPGAGRDRRRRRPTNRMLATPYTRRLCSQWNVDQAAALVLVSAAEADRRGVPRDRWVFPWAAAESNAMIPMPARAELHRSPAVAPVGASAGRRGRRAGVAGRGRPGRPLQLLPGRGGRQARELGLDEARPLTVTGGMTFGGGPLNNYVLQATAAMVQRAAGRSPAPPGWSPPSAG